MSSVKPKHPIALALVGLFSEYIYSVNRRWGVPHELSLLLAVQTFLMIGAGFFCVWEIRDGWLRRWEGTNLAGEGRGGGVPLRSSCEQLVVEPLDVPVPGPGGVLSAAVVSRVTNGTRGHGRGTIVLCHGYSDTQADLGKYAFALALAGYEVVTYDARGQGLSKNVGSRNDFFSRFHVDFPAVVDRVHALAARSNLTLYAVGESVGASTVVTGGLADDRLARVVGLATIADHRRNLPRFPVPFSGKFWLKLRYAFYGVPQHPTEDVNRAISPVHVVADLRRRWSGEVPWERHVNQKLLLVHAKNDKIIPASRLEQNVAAAGLHGDNHFTFRRGGHTFLRQETKVVGLLCAALRVTSPEVDRRE
ncbi:MAG: hypothetical protein Kow0069_07100 [Promethearchaeota archaeon]